MSIVTPNTSIDSSIKKCKGSSFLAYTYGRQAMALKASRKEAFIKYRDAINFNLWDSGSRIGITVL
jgi:hypothetical protein